MRFSAILKPFIVILLCSFLFQGCVFSNCNKINFSASDQEWIPSYEEGDMLFFSDGLQTDTFVVSSILNVYTPCNKISLSPYQYSRYSIELKPSRCLDSFFCGVHVNVSKEYLEADDPAKVSIRVGNLSLHQPDSLIQLEDIMMVYSKDANLDDTSDLCIEGNSLGNSPIDFFTWNKKQGLLSYKLKGGGHFIKKQP